MIDLLVEYRHWLAGTVKRRLRRMARECRHESGQEG